MCNTDNIVKVEKGDCIFLSNRKEAENLELVQSIFEKNPESIIYVVDQVDRLIGVVTLGNVCRNIFTPKNWLNDKFKFVFDGEEEKAKEIFRKYLNINAIPILSCNNNIIGEFRRIIENHEDKLKGILEWYENNSNQYSFFQWLHDQNIKKIVLLKNEHDKILNIFRNNNNLVEIDYADKRNLFLEEKTIFAAQNIICYKKNRISFLKKSINSFLCLVDLLEDYQLYYNTIIERWNQIKERKKKSLDAGLKELGIDYLVIARFTSLEKKIIEEIISQVNDIVVVEEKKGEYYPQESVFISGLQSGILIDNKYVTFAQFLLKLLDVVSYSMEELVRKFYKLAENNIKVYYFALPQVEKLNLEEKEKIRIKESIDLCVMLKEPTTYKSFFDDFFGKDKDLEYIHEMNRNGKTLETGEFRRLIDSSNPYKTVIAGKRVTVNQPEIYDNTIWMIGPCTVFGHYVENEQTISSFLQKSLNQKKLNIKYRVENLGMPALSSNELGKVLENICYIQGDIVVILYENWNNLIELSEKYVEFHDTNLAFTPPPPSNYGEWFIDIPAHMNYRGNKNLAYFIENKIEKSLVQSRRERVPFYIEKSNFNIGKELEEKVISFYQPLRLDQEKRNASFTNIGCIVMNCNPFTYGHQYLVEYAAKRVDLLYCFVVQEDKSDFSFKDRFELVKRGTCHLENVVVKPSGDFIISKITFPDYFTKELNQAQKINTVMDVEIFSNIIAPILHISKRFVGQEPFDLITRQYNETMAEYFPRYNIEYVEIPRKEIGDEPISASLVRKSLKEKNYQKIKKLVPISTYQYLLDKY